MFCYEFTWCKADGGVNLPQKEFCQRDDYFLTKVTFPQYNKLKFSQVGCLILYILLEIE